MRDKRSMRKKRKKKRRDIETWWRIFASKKKNLRTRMQSRNNLS